MQKKFYLLIISTMLAALALASCTKEAPTAPAPEKIKATPTPDRAPQEQFQLATHKNLKP